MPGLASSLPNQLQRLKVPILPCVLIPTLVFESHFSRQGYLEAEFDIVICFLKTSLAKVL